MTDIQWLRIRSFLDTYSVLRVGKDARCHLFVEALRGMARMGASWHPRTGSGTRSIAAWPTSASGASGRAGWPTCRPSWSCARGCGRPVVHARAPKTKGRDPALGRTGGGGFRSQIHSLADQRGRPLCLRLTGGLRQRRLSRVVGATGYQGRHSRPQGAHEPPAPRPGTVPGAQRRETGPRLAHARAARGHPIRPIRTSLLGLSVSGRGLDLDAIKDPQNLICVFGQGCP